MQVFDACPQPKSQTKLVSPKILLCPSCSITPMFHIWTSLVLSRTIQQSYSVRSFFLKPTILLSLLFIRFELVTCCQRMRRPPLQVNPPSPSPSALEPQRISSPSPSHYNSSSLFFFLGGIVVLIILLILIFVFRKFLKPSELKHSIARRRAGNPDFFSGSLRTVTYFDFHTLKKATKNFHASNFLGRGGFGSVYQGKLRDGTLVAVKQLHVDKSQQGEAEFLSEVRLITSIQHKNLVRLLGCCSDGSQRLLVYEYMKNRSLEFIIYGKTEQFLDWSIRFQIIIGVARALQYLHEDSHLRIVHRDIKASNILLDDKFHPRIGDFGLARFFPEDQAYLSTAFAGTLGYTAPEYAIRGELSEKADIYSFGVLMLEIISCRKNTDLTLPSEQQYLPEYAWKLYERSEVLNLVDPKMQQHGYEEKGVLEAVDVALLCLQPHPSLRPPMSQIVALLTSKGERAMTPVRPAFLDRRRKKHDSTSWDTISEVFPSPIRTDSPSLTRKPN